MTPQAKEELVPTRSRRTRRTSLARPSREEAVDLLFRRHYGQFVGLAYTVLGARDEAEDAVQDAFVSLYAQWNRIRDHAAAEAYLRSAVLNRCRSRMRQRTRDRVAASLQLLVSVGDDTEATVTARTESERLARALRLLPRRQCEAVACRYLLELSVAETAAQLGISAGSVKRHTHRAIRTLNTRLEVTP